MDIAGSTVGIAFVDRICSDDASLGVTQDGGRSLESVSSTAAHELGHVFAMAHDGDVCKAHTITTYMCVYNLCTYAAFTLL